MGSRVLITGASAGIGWEAALCFAGRGDQLFLTARREERLQQLVEECRQGGSPESLYAVYDLSVPGEGARLVDDCLERLGGLDILICNAGYGLFGPMVDVDSAQMARIWQVNFQSAYESIHRVLPHFLRKRAGHIILTSSIIGKKAMPYASAYCATKFAQLGLGEALWGELRDSGIGVTVICPGFTETEFQGMAARTGGTPALDRPISGQSPKVVAQSMLAAVEKRKREVHLTMGGRLLLLLDRLSPALATRVMAGIGKRERRPEM